MRDRGKNPLILPNDHTHTLGDQSSDASLQDVVQDIQAMLGNSVAARWYQMGTCLGTPVGELESIRVLKDTTPIDKQAKMFHAWLSSIETNKTWQWLVDAVGHNAGGKHQKMAKILSEHQPGINILNGQKLKS